MSQKKILGDQLDTTDVTASLDTFTSSLKGLVPSSGGGTTNFLRADGTWASPGGGVTSITGTADQITASASTGSVTLSLPGSVILPGSLTVTSTSQFNANVTAAAGNIDISGTANPQFNLLATGGQQWSVGYNNGSGIIGFYDTTGANWGMYVANGSTGAMTLPRNIASTNTTTGSLVVTGGVGIGGALNVGGAISGSNLSGTNTGDQTITLTGAVTGSGTGSFATTLANSVVTNAKMANMNNNTVKGNVSGSAAAPSDLTATQLTTLVNTFTSTLSGAAPASGGGTTNFLRADGTWAVPPGTGGTVTSVSVTSANGFAGTVATATTTPAITLSTTVTGMVKGNGTSISAATAGTDYSAGTSALATGVLKSTTTTGALSIATGSDLNSTYGSQTANFILAAPNGSAGTPTFRAGVPTDVGLANVTNDAQVKLSTFTTAGDMMYATGSAAVTRLAIGSSSQVLIGGASAPSWTNISGLNVNSATTATTATTATNATNIAITNDVATATSVYPVWSGANTGNNGAKVSSTKLSFVPSTGILTATGFSGPLNGTVGATTPNTGSFTTITASNKTSITGTGTAGALYVKGTNLMTDSVVRIDLDDSGGSSAALAIKNLTNWAQAGAFVTIQAANGSDSGALISMTNAGTGNYFTCDSNASLTKSGNFVSKTNATAAPTTKTTNYSMTATDSSLIFNGAGSITLTLQAASSYPGRWLYVKTIAAQTVVSASSNVVPIGSSTAGTAILAATAGKWAALQSDGTNWVVMMSN